MTARYSKTIVVTLLLFGCGENATSPSSPHDEQGLPRLEITSRSEVGAWRNTYAQIDLTLSGRDTADTKYPVEFAIMSDGGDTLYRRPEPLDIRTWRLRLIENIGSPEPGWRTGTDIGRSIGRMAMGPWRIAVDTIPRGWFHAWFDMHGRRVAKDSVRVRIRMMN